MTKPSKIIPPAGGPREFVAMDMWRPLLKTLDSNQLVLGITDRFKELVRAVLTSRTTACRIESLFMDNLVVPCGIPKYVLANNGTQVISTIFESLWAF